MDDTFLIARLGIEVQEWFSSKIGKFVIDRSVDEIEDAQLKLLDVDPEDTKEIKRLQSQAEQARLAIVWLNQAIADGEAAYINLQEEESNE